MRESVHSYWSVLEELTPTVSLLQVTFISQHKLPEWLSYGKFALWNQINWQVRLTVIRLAFVVLWNPHFCVCLGFCTSNVVSFNASKISAGSCLLPQSMNFLNHLLTIEYKITHSQMCYTFFLQNITIHLFLIITYSIICFKISATVISCTKSDDCSNDIGV